MFAIWDCNLKTLVKNDTFFGDGLTLIFSEDQLFKLREKLLLLRDKHGAARFQAVKIEFFNI